MHVDGLAGAVGDDVLHVDEVTAAGEDVALLDLDSLGGAPAQWYDQLFGTIGETEVVALDRVQIVMGGQTHVAGQAALEEVDLGRVVLEQAHTDVGHLGIDRVGTQLGVVDGTARRTQRQLEQIGRDSDMLRSGGSGCRGGLLHVRHGAAFGRGRGRYVRYRRLVGGAAGRERRWFDSLRPVVCLPRFPDHETEHGEGDDENEADVFHEETRIRPGSLAGW